VYPSDLNHAVTIFGGWLMGKTEIRGINIMTVVKNYISDLNFG